MEAALAQVQIGGTMPPLPNSDEMAEMFGIETIHGLEATFIEHASL